MFEKENGERLKASIKWRHDDIWCCRLASPHITTTLLVFNEKSVSVQYLAHRHRRIQPCAAAIGIYSLQWDFERMGLIVLHSGIYNPDICSRASVSGDSRQQRV